MALVAALTVGAALLLALESWLFPRTPQWRENAALTAERAVPIELVEVSYVPTLADFDMAAVADDTSICLVEIDGAARWEPRGPRVSLVVVGTTGDALPDLQKRTLLSALGSLRQSGAQHGDAVPVRLAAEIGVPITAQAPPPVDDLYKFLERKGFLQDRP
jgi:hypothetical protein